jgi:hypothetical protein
VGIEGPRRLGPFGAFHDDAVDVGGGVLLVGEAGPDEPAEDFEQGLDAAELLHP